MKQQSKMLKGRRKCNYMERRNKKHEEQLIEDTQKKKHSEKAKKFSALIKP